MSEPQNPAQASTLLNSLRFLAYNLRWSWNAIALRVFERLDPVQWAACRHNPVLLLSRFDPITLEIATRDRTLLDDVEYAVADLRAYLAGRHTWWTQLAEREPGASGLLVAYFSAEFAITEALPIFSGGLGVLAGDHLKSASDLGVPLVAVGLLYREGYFAQRVDRHGTQHEAYEHLDPPLLPLTLERRADNSPLLVAVPMLDHFAHAQVWRADVGRVRLYLLDTDVPLNTTEDRRITDRLYGGDNEHRLRQEIVLGIGGMRALDALGIEPTVVHLNEGHAAFAAVERVRRHVMQHGSLFLPTAQRLAHGVVFTTHTPVPAGHDMFATTLMERYLGGYVWEMRQPWRRFLSLGRHDATDDDEPFNMTLLALRLSGRRNAVSNLHGVVSRRMWWGTWHGIAERDVPIGYITNGVHLPTWVAPPMATIYSTYVGDAWLEESDEVHWQRAAHIPLEALWRVRNQQREHLVQLVRRTLARQEHRRGNDSAWTQSAFNPDALTIVFARRFATYKRATLLLTDPARLERILAHGDVQFVFAGKSHPRDDPGKDLLRQIFLFAAQPHVRERFVFVEEYDVDLARVLTSGADVWLNLPRRPYEASGTSGMKAAANGALNLSIPDGWWAEAWTDRNDPGHPIGWSIGAPVDGGQDRADADALYTLLETGICPLFRERNEDGLPVQWCERIRSSVRNLVPFFNTHRMVSEYVRSAYLPAHADAAAHQSELLRSG